jgi:hypothetical protein
MVEGESVDANEAQVAQSMQSAKQGESEGLDLEAENAHGEQRNRYLFKSNDNKYYASV